MRIGTQCSSGLLKRAFRKLLAYAYYDKNDMHLRRSISEFVNKISQSQSVEDAIFDSLERIANGQDEESLERLLGEIRLLYFPKKLKNKETLDKRYVTNAPREENEVARLLIRSYIPVELLIIDVAWIIQHGYVLDMALSENCKGNRLILDENGTNVCEDGNVLFYNYSHQYKNWWMKGIEVANENLKEDRDITIVNLDITNFYHTLDIDFESVVQYISSREWHGGVRGAGTTNVVRRILQKYSEIAHASGLKVFNESKNSKPLPLSLLSSSLLANWYLKPLDDLIENNFEPLYYARYVDDLMLVVESKSSEEEPMLRAQKELKPLLKKNANGNNLFIDVQQNKIDELVIQQEKVYVYSFDTSISQIGMQKYVSEQIERSSEFRFLTDEVESADLNLDNLTLIGALDANNDEDKRFDILEMSRYKLAVYFTKLSLRLAKCESDAKNAENRGDDERLQYDEKDKLRKEVDKIYSYFRSVLLIKHYKCWEKILTVFVLAERYDYLDAFVERCEHAVRNVQLASAVSALDNVSDVLSNLRETLIYHLEQSKLMALSLNWNGSCIDMVYCDTLMVRKNYNSLPLQEFSSMYMNKGVKLTLSDMEPYAQILSKNRRWVPYHVRFADVVCACSLGKSFSEDVYEQAWMYYCRMNAYAYIKSEFKDFVYFTEENGITVAEFNTEHTSTQPTPEKINVSLVEMELNNSPEDMIKSYGKGDADYNKKLRVALDKVSEIANTNVFVMPECSLSLSSLKEFYQYSAKRRVAFICGMKYYVCDDNVYNYIVTCLPIMLNGRADAVPVIRRKCFYAPEEVQKIVQFGLKKPNVEEVQVLYHWKGHVFTTYCCYELCNPKHRSFFYSKIDAMYCPVHNRDTYYFNNIAESTARDMHCYFVLSNVSRYGDSRVSYPAKHDRMNLLKVTGGNTKEYDVTVLSCTLEYGKLRTFQREFKWEVGLGKNEIIKPLPPGYRQDLLNYREMAFMLSVESLNKNIMQICTQIQANKI